MNSPLHFIVSRWRGGWAVSADADRLSDHADLEDARSAAERLTRQAQLDGAAATTVDLSED